MILLVFCAKLVTVCERRNVKLHFFENNPFFIIYAIFSLCIFFVKILSGKLWRGFADHLSFEHRADQWGSLIWHDFGYLNRWMCSYNVTILFLFMTWWLINDSLNFDLFFIKINLSNALPSLSIIGVSVHGLVQISDDGQELRIQNLDLSYEFKNIQVQLVWLQP